MWGMTTPGMQLAIDNELALLTPSIRGNPSKVAALLDQEFQEIGASGRLWSRESMISALASEPSDDGGPSRPARFAASSCLRT
jgi:hypothetical protein